MDVYGLEVPRIVILWYSSPCAGAHRSLHCIACQHIQMDETDA
jgi:hypothetical protein